LKISTAFAIEKYAPGIENLLEKYKENEARELEHPVLFDGIPAHLEETSNQGVRNYLVSHRNDQVLEILAKTEIAPYFTEVVTADDGFPRKPDPTSMLYLKDKYAIESGLVIGETAIVEKGVLLYHGVTLGGTGKDVGKRHPTVRKGALISAHAQVIGPVEIGENAKVGAAAVVVADVPSDVTVVGIPAKIVRVHGKKDEPVIHEVEEKREYYVNKLEQAKEASHRSSGL